MSISRRGILVAAPTLLIGVAHAGQNSPSARESAGDEEPLYPGQKPEWVREFVGASHAKVDRVREMLAEHPALAKCAWDWGFGDWETALGAASHTGQREIAAMLIEHGARPDLFTLAMLGQLDALRALITANPGIQRTHGPHGITLLKHARAGGDKSAAVVEYLLGLGDADVGQKSVPLAEEWAARYRGKYSAGPRPQEKFSITEARGGGLAIRSEADGAPRQLFHQGAHAFHPTGAPHVAIRFDVQGENVVALEIVDGPAKRRFARTEE